MTNENVRRFIHLQEKINHMIDAYGECDHQIADELEELGDKLTFEEMDAICEWYHNNKSSKPPKVDIG